MLNFSNLYLWYVITPCAFLVLFYISKIAFAILFVWFKKNANYELILKPIKTPLSLLTSFLALSLARILLKISPEISEFFYTFNTVIFVLSATLFIKILASYLFFKLKENLQEKGQSAILATIPLLHKISSILIVIIGLLYILKVLGFNINAIIAAFGVGGLAIALASQKTVENLFGGVVLAVDQPIRVGDFGKFGGFLGTVIDLGLRSTKVQTNNRTIVSVPNASLSADVIENFATRDKILINQNFVLKYANSADELSYFIANLEKMLKENPEIESETARARLVKFESNGLGIEIFCYALTSDFPTFLIIQENVMLKIIEMAQKETKGFAEMLKI
jgi:MscS family membrane protein